jgi:hypothetical protein
MLHLPEYSGFRMPLSRGTTHQPRMSAHGKSGRASDGNRRRDLPELLNPPTPDLLA